MDSISDYAHMFLAELYKRTSTHDLKYHDIYDIGRTCKFPDSFTDKIVKELTQHEMGTHFGRSPQTTKIAITDHGRQFVNMNYFKLVG
jgi:hypothetical protein